MTIVRSIGELFAAAVGRLAETRYPGDVVESGRVGHDALDVVGRNWSDRVRAKVEAIQTNRAGEGNLTIAELCDGMRPLMNARE